MKKLISSLMVGILLLQNFSPLFSYNYSVEELFAGLKKSVEKVTLLSQKETQPLKEIVLYGEVEDSGGQEEKEKTGPAQNNEKETSSGANAKDLEEKVGEIEEIENSMPAQNEGEILSGAEVGDGDKESETLEEIEITERNADKTLETEDLDEQQTEKNNSEKNSSVANTPSEGEEETEDLSTTQSGEEMSFGKEEIMNTLLFQPLSLNPSDIELTTEITTAGQTVTINKYFANSYTVDRGDGSLVEELTDDTTHAYSMEGNYIITLSLIDDARWAFQQLSKPLVPKIGTTASNIYINKMPSLSEYFGNSNISVGGYFFMNFNYQGALTSLPAGSFDTSKITTVGIWFFYGFNQEGALTSLPAGSFDTSNITTVGQSFFYGFNRKGYLTSLPEGSFNTSKITTASDYFFIWFNNEGALTNLPEGSFNISNISNISDQFFYGFNQQGALTSLPAGSFNTSHITNAGTAFFYSFNQQGALKNLPEGSFNTSKITSVGHSFFRSFNQQGALTSLPEGSFNTSKITSAGTYFFASFNTNGALTRDATSGIEIKNASSSAVVFDYRTGTSTNNTLSVSKNGFFRYYAMERDTRADIELTAEITAAGETVTINKYFANSYTVDRGDGSSVENVTAAITHTYTAAGTYPITLSMTDGTRWNFSNTQTLVPKYGTTATNVYVSVMPSLSDYFGDSSTAPGDYFFFSFNVNGALTSLPAGSFDTEHITTVGKYFFASFNNDGTLTSLPTESFDTSNIITVGEGFFDSFNYAGALTSLPEGSFDTSNITTVDILFFPRFNYNGAITNLPDSFKRPALDEANASKFFNFDSAFYSPNYTLNRSADLIVNGGATPNTDRNTFSDNQPGRCLVDDNWLANVPTDCSSEDDMKWTWGHSSAVTRTVSYSKINSGDVLKVNCGGGVLTLTNTEFSCTYATPGEYQATISNPEILSNTLSLDSKGITSFWGGNANNLDTLNLSWNSISAYSGGAFDKLTSLTKLQAGGGNIETLPDGLFDNLTELEVLHISRQHLISLPDGLFDNLTKIKEIAMDNNQLLSLPENIKNLSSLQTFIPGNNCLDIAQMSSDFSNFIDAKNPGWATPWRSSQNVCWDIAYTPTTFTSGTVLADINLKKSGLTVTNNGGNTGYTFTGNGNFVFELDYKGYTGTATAIVDWIVGPVTGTISYDISSLTSGNVVANISFNKTGVNITNNSGNDSYLFTGNGSFTFEFIDSYGNTGSETATVTRIDKIPPIATTLTFSPNTPTNGNVVTTIHFSEPIQNLTGRTMITSGQYTKTYASNTDETLMFYDLVGNVGSTGILIDWIDSNPVTGNISYDVSSLTSGDVVANISFNKTRVNITNNSGNDFYPFTGNGSFTFEFIDSYGNTGSETATVTRIDKIPPFIASLTYSPNTTTSNPVTVTIVLSESGSVVGWTKIDDITYTKTYSSNITETITLQDFAGNTATDTIAISWIQQPTTPGSNGGGGSVSIKKDRCPNGDNSPSYYDGTCEASSENDDQHGAAEEAEKDSLSTYEWAKKFGLTSMKTYEAFRPNDGITRVEMAKIITKYVEEFDNADPSSSLYERDECNEFSDLYQVNGELKPYIIKSCNLGLMGWNAERTAVKSEFNPFVFISKAEVATILSRMLRGEKNTGSEKRRYHNHLLALRKKKFIQHHIDPMSLDTRENVYSILKSI